MIETHLMDVPGSAVHPLGPADHHEFAKLLGLTAFQFRYIEQVAGHPLRAWAVGPSTVPEWPGFQGAGEDGLPCLTRNHGALCLAEQPPLGPTTLWEQCIAFPYNLWGGRAHGPEAGGEVTTPDSAVWQAFVELRQAFGRLESRIAQAEVTVLEVQGTDGSMGLFFHTLRRNAPVIGRIRPLPDPATLLGTSYQRLRWDVPPPSAADPVSLVRALKTSLETLLEARGVTGHCNRPDLLVRLPV